MISRPLTELLKKGVPYLWSPTTQEAFFEASIGPSPSLLAIPNFTKEFILETGASDTGFGAVLMQNGHQIAYLSKPVCPKN